MTTTATVTATATGAGPGVQVVARDMKPHATFTWRGYEVVLEALSGETRGKRSKYPQYLDPEVFGPPSPPSTSPPPANRPTAGMGYFPGLPAEDGDSLDVVVGPGLTNQRHERVYLIEQRQAAAPHEHVQWKVMIGWSDEASAVRAFRTLWPPEAMQGEVLELDAGDFDQIALPLLAPEAEHEHATATAVTVRATCERTAALLRLYHGTKARFSRPDPDRSGLGVHLGTEAAARDRLALAERAGDERRGRLLAFDVEVVRPLRLRDLGTWDLGAVQYALEEAGVLPETETELLTAVQLRRAIEAAGYDSVVYENRGEGIGSDSYVVWRSEQIRAASTTGAGVGADGGVRIKAVADDHGVVVNPESARYYEHAVEKEVGDWQPQGLEREQVMRTPTDGGLELVELPATASAPGGLWLERPAGTGDGSGAGGGGGTGGSEPVGERRLAGLRWTTAVAFLPDRVRTPPFVSALWLAPEARANPYVALGLLRRLFEVYRERVAVPKADGLVHGVGPFTPNGFVVARRFADHLFPNTSALARWAAQKRGARVGLRIVAAERTRTAAAGASSYHGRAGAGLMLACPADGTVLLVRRSHAVRQPGTWGIPDGALDDSTNEDPFSGALREAEEELGTLPSVGGPLRTSVFRDGDFTFTTYVMTVTPEAKATFKPRLNWENVDAQWFPLSQLPTALHFGVQHTLDEAGGAANLLVGGADEAGGAGEAGVRVAVAAATAAAVGTSARTRDIVVTIPASRLADVEAEEAEVAECLARGEAVHYWWSLGRLPREQPRRIYFVWNGAVRAYHDVIGVDVAQRRVLMDPVIHTVEPEPMVGFRGFRYYSPSASADGDLTKRTTAATIVPPVRALEAAWQEHQDTIMTAAAADRATWVARARETYPDDPLTPPNHVVDAVRRAFAPVIERHGGGARLIVRTWYKLDGPQAERTYIGPGRAYRTEFPGRGGGGGGARREGANFVEISIALDLPRAQGVDWWTFKSELLSVLGHELVHVEQGQRGMRSFGDDESETAYFSNPHEIGARAWSIARDLVDSGFVGPGEILRGDLPRALYGPTWARYLATTDEQTRKRVTRRVMDILRTLGTIMRGDTARWKRYWEAKSRWEVEDGDGDSGRPPLAVEGVRISARARADANATTDGEDDGYRVRTSTVPDLEQVHVRRLPSRNGFAVWLVDGTYVRDHVWQDFTCGGNPARYDFIPPGEIWIDAATELADLEPYIEHELAEVVAMTHGAPYDEAHETANKAERAVRQAAIYRPRVGDVYRVLWPPSSPALPAETQVALVKPSGAVVLVPAGAGADGGAGVSVDGPTFASWVDDGRIERRGIRVDARAYHGTPGGFTVLDPDYDSTIYRNSKEDMGRDSWIVWDPKLIRHVETLPWAPAREKAGVRSATTVATGSDEDRLARARSALEAWQAQPAGKYAETPSQELLELGDRFKRQLVLARQDGREDDAQQRWLPRVRAIEEEKERRSRYYEIQRRILALEEGVRSGRLVLGEGEVAALLGRPRDVYAEAGLLPPYDHRPDLFRVSDLSGAKVRHYVVLPDGRIGHPDEIHDARRRGRIIVVPEVQVPHGPWPRSRLAARTAACLSAAGPGVRVTAGAIDVERWLDWLVSRLPRARIERLFATPPEWYGDEPGEPSPASTQLAGILRRVLGHPTVQHELGVSFRVEPATLPDGLSVYHGGMLAQRHTDPETTGGMPYQILFAVSADSGNWDQFEYQLRRLLGHELIHVEQARMSGGRGTVSRPKQPMDAWGDPNPDYYAQPHEIQAIARNIAQWLVANGRDRVTQDLMNVNAVELDGWKWINFFYNPDFAGPLPPEPNERRPNRRLYNTLLREVARYVAILSAGQPTGRSAGVHVRVAAAVEGPGSATRWRRDFDRVMRIVSGSPAREGADLLRTFGRHFDDWLREHGYPSIWWSFAAVVAQVEAGKRPLETAGLRDDVSNVLSRVRSRPPSSDGGLVVLDVGSPRVTLNQQAPGPLPSAGDAACRDLVARARAAVARVRAAERAGLVPDPGLGRGGEVAEIRFVPEIRGREGTRATYDAETDRIEARLDAGVPTLVHEFGHRAYTQLDPQARASWEETIGGTVADLRSETWGWRFDRFLRPDLVQLAGAKVFEGGAGSGDPIQHALEEALRARLRRTFPGRDSIPRLEAADAFLREPVITLDEVTPYGSTDPQEAFAETFRRLVLEGLGAVPSWTRDLFGRLGKRTRVGRAGLRVVAAGPDLVEGHNGPRPPLAAIDLDGTLLEAPEPADYEAVAGTDRQPRLGRPLPGAVEAVRTLSDRGWTVQVFTARMDPRQSEEIRARWRQEIVEHLAAYGISVKGVYDTQDGKPRADVFVDDRAVAFNGDWSAALAAVLSRRNAGVSPSRIVLRRVA